MRRLFLPFAAVVAGLVFTPSPAVAQNQGKGKNQSAQQAKQERDTAQSKLKDASQELGKAQKEADKAEAAHQAALAKLQKARQAAAAEHGRKLGLPAALAQRDAAQRAVDTAQKTLSKEIRAQSDYQDAAKEAEKAGTRLREVREDTALADDKKKELTADLSKAIRHPTELERERIEADAGIKQLRVAATETGRQAASIQTEVQKAVEDDAEVKAAVQAERDEADKAKKAHDEVDKHKKEVAAAQKKTNTEQQQYQKAQSQSKTKKGK